MDLSRRGFLKAGAVGAVGLGLTGLGAAGARGAGKRIPVGLQLYSVRGPLGKDVEGVIAQVAEMGYEGVEFAGYYNKDADEWKKLLDKNGLVCCGSHVRGHELQEKNLEKTTKPNPRPINKK
jgi:hypothetical protein